MLRAAQLAAVVIALMLVLGAGGYGIGRGLTGESNAAFDYCVKEYDKEWPLITRGRFSSIRGSASDFCHAYLRGEVTSLR